MHSSTLFLIASLVLSLNWKTSKTYSFLTLSTVTLASLSPSLIYNTFVLQIFQFLFSNLSSNIASTFALVSASQFIYLYYILWKPFEICSRINFRLLFILHKCREMHPRGMRCIRNNVEINKFVKLIKSHSELMVLRCSAVEHFSAVGAWVFKRFDFFTYFFRPHRFLAGIIEWRNSGETEKLTSVFLWKSFIALWTVHPIEWTLTLLTCCVHRVS